MNRMSWGDILLLAAVCSRCQDWKTKVPLWYNQQEVSSSYSGEMHIRFREIINSPELHKNSPKDNEGDKSNVTMLYIW